MNGTDLALGWGEEWGGGSLGCGNTPRPGNLNQAKVTMFAPELEL